MANDVRFKESPIYTANSQCDKPIVVNQGGSSSGKTYSILQLLLVLGWSEPNSIITIVGQDMPNLKIGAMRTLGFVLKDNKYFADMVKGVNRTDWIWTLHSGSTIEFKSFDNAQDAQGGRRDYLFVNEAMGVDYAIFDQLNIRTEKKVFIDYNPTVPFWVHNKLIGQPYVQLFISNYKHNESLSPKIVAKIEAYRDNPKDAEKWKVYGLGLTGSTEGVIFKYVNWISEFPKDIKRHSWGMDFGFTNDPTTLVKCGVSDGELFLERWMYEYGMTTKDIDLALKELGVSKKDRIYADSADPKTIKELRLLGWDVKGAKKGADSIRHGIDKIKKYEALNIVNCEHWKLEQISYIWGVDKKTLEPTNKPIDKFNHLWDSTRYGIQGLKKRRAKTTVR
jgi:phage terminase large subunit